MQNVCSTDSALKTFYHLPPSITLTPISPESKCQHRPIREEKSNYREVSFNESFKSLVEDTVCVPNSCGHIKKTYLGDKSSADKELTGHSRKTSYRQPSVGILSPNISSGTTPIVSSTDDNCHNSSDSTLTFLTSSSFDLNPPPSSSTISVGVPSKTDTQSLYTSNPPPLIPTRFVEDTEESRAIDVSHFASPKVEGLYSLEEKPLVYTSLSNKSESLGYPTQSIKSDHLDYDSLSGSQNPLELQGEGDISSLPSFDTSFTPPSSMDSAYFQRCPEVFRTNNYCPSGVMTTLSEGFISEMPSASSSSPPGTPETAIVVINGISSTMSAGEHKGGIISQRNNGSTSTTTSSSTVTPLLTIVPSRVVVTSAASGQHSPSSVTKGTLDSPQIIVVSEGDASLDSTSNGTGGGGVQPTAVNIGVGGTFVQYVEAASEPIYSHSNGQIAYPVYTVGDTTMYAASPTYYTAGTTPVTYSQEVANSPVGGPILAPGSSTFILQQEVETEPHPIITPSRHSPQTEGGITYMVSGSNSNGGGSGGGTPQLDADAQANIAHATRVSPVTVQWLLDNYETAEGVSLPRSTLYNHYLYHCADHKLDPVNSASFGKLIRSVFMGLRTRRLGTRGNSKYHYYGIRVKPSSDLNSLNEDGEVITNLRHQGSSSKKSHQAHGQQESSQSQSHQGKGITSSGNAKSGDSFDTHMTSEPSPQTVHNQQYLGECSVAIPHIPPFVGHLPAGVTRNHVELFLSMYQEHIENILDVVFNLQFSLMEGVWRRFWALHGNNNNNNNNNADKTSSSDGSDDDEGELASKFSTNVLNSLLRSQPILDMMKDVDYQFYQNLVEVLIPDVLRSIPPALTQSIRNFAKSLEGWLTSALGGYPQEVILVKVNAVSSLAQTLRRYTSLNHLAQAARAVLQNSSQINQMLSDLNRVDFRNVQEQASWVCECDPSLVERLEEDFKKTLQQQNSLEQWAKWLHAVVEQTLMSHADSHDFAKQARQFLLKWSFYSSMVIRDLTLRSAASFGSFHLIRLLYDEYMFYLVEHKVATAMGLTPIAVMSQFLGVSKVQTIVNTNISGDGEELFNTSIKRPKFEDS